MRKICRFHKIAAVMAFLLVFSGMPQSRAASQTQVAGPPARTANPAPAASTATPPDADVDSLASVKEQMTQCSGLDDYVLRLQCFDKFAETVGFLQPAGTEDELAKFGFWRATAKRNSAGESTLNMRLVSNAPYVSANGVSRMPELILSCKVKHTDAYIDWEAPLTVVNSGARKLEVIYHFDADAPVSTSWEYSLDGYAIFIAHALDFIQSMHGKKSLTMQLTPPGDSLATLTYSLNGLENILNLMYERCYK